MKLTLKYRVARSITPDRNSQPNLVKDIVKKINNFSIEEKRNQEHFTVHQSHQFIVRLVRTCLKNQAKQMGRQFIERSALSKSRRGEPHNVSATWVTYIIRIGEYNCKVQVCTYPSSFKKVFIVKDRGATV